MPYKAPELDPRIFMGRQGNDPYLSYLANVGQQNGARGILAGAALRGAGAGSGPDVQAYMAALEQQNANQLAGSEFEGKTDLGKSYLSALAPMAQAGISGAVNIPSMSGFVDTNPAYLQAADTVQLDREAQAAFADRAKGLVDIGTAGYMVDAPTFGGMIAGPLDETAPVVAPYMTPKDANDKITADAATTRANAAMYNATHNGGGGDSEGGASSGGGKVKVEFSPFGMAPTTTFTGTPAQAAAYQAQQGGGGGGKGVKEAPAGYKLERQGANSNYVSKGGRVFIYNKRTGDLKPVR